MPLHMGISICAFAHYIVRHFNEFKYKLLTSGLVLFGAGSGLRPGQQMPWAGERTLRKTIINKHSSNR